MANKANVRSLDALGNLRVALLRFEDEARRSSSAIVVEAQRVVRWLQQEQPQYWKHQVEVAYQQLAEARAMLMKCRMRRTGDFKPTCYDEQKMVERCKKRLEHSRHMVEAIKHWSIKTAHDFDEYTSRAAQLNRCLDGDIPRAVGLLERLLIILENYAGLQQATVLDNFYFKAESESSTDDGDDKNSTGADGTNQQSAEPPSAKGDNL